MDPFPEAVSATPFATVMATWRTRALERKAAEPPHTQWNALRLSLEAVAEAIAERRPFSWACSQRERVAAQDHAVSAGFRGALA